jgi:hypothetical protein
MSTFDDDFAAVETLFTEVFGVAINYSIGGSVVITGLDAQVSINQYQVFDSDDIAGIANSRDYLVTKADLLNGITPFLPAPRHRITETIDGISRNFEVMQMPGRPCYEPADAADRMLVIHTKEI